MQLEEGRKSQPAKKKEETTTREIYFIILKKNILHVLEVRRKMMRKYDVEWKDTYIHINNNFKLFII